MSICWLNSCKDSFCHEYVIWILKTEIINATEENIYEMNSTEQFDLNIKVNGTNIYDLGVGTLASTLISTANGISPYAKVYVTDSSGKQIDNNSTVKTSYNLVISTVSGGSQTYQLSIHGDVNSDGNVNIQDLLRIQKHILGSINLGGAENKACDVNADGTINIQDLLRVQKYLLGSLSL